MLSDFPSHLPFIDERTLVARELVVLEVQEHPTYGLRTPGRSGYLINDGPGPLSVRTSDNGERWSKAETAKSGELVQYEHDDDVWLHSVEVVAGAVGASYRSKFVRQAKE